MTLSEKLTTVAENQQKVFDAGYKKGKTDGGDTETAYNNGIQAEYDRFWDTYQQNGSRVHYAHAFAGTGWNSETLKPKYPVISNYCFEMFRDCGEIDLTKVGVTFDFSQNTSFSNFAHSSKVTHFGVIDTTGANAFSYTFCNCYKLTTIDKLILKADGSQTLGENNAFSGCGCLENIVIEGVIGNNISFKWSPLTKASIKSVIAALSDTTTGKTATFNQTAVDTAFETSEGAGDGSASDVWLALVATKENWTVSLV